MCVNKQCEWKIIWNYIQWIRQKRYKKARESQEKLHLWFFVYALWTSINFKILVVRLFISFYNASTGKKSLVIISLHIMNRRVHILTIVLNQFQ